MIHLKASEARKLGLTEKRRKKAKSATSNLAQEMFEAHGLFGWVPEYRFAEPRKWRWDWANPEAKLALEIQGGLFVQGRHSRGAALLKEHEKLNTGAARGWRVLFCTPQQFNSGAIFPVLREALGLKAVWPV